MKKLSKTQLAEMEAIAIRLDDNHALLDDAINQFNAHIAEAWTYVAKAIEDYNGAVREANEFASNIAGDIQSYVDDRSEKWQESDAASTYQEWLYYFEEELPEAGLAKPEDVEMDSDLADGDAVRELPVGVSL